jgi:hypothetical protein
MEIVGGILLGGLICVAILGLQRAIQPLPKAKKINNTQAHHLASRNYYLIQVHLGGEWRTMLFTEREVEVAETRANQNPEDIWLNR